MYRKTFVCLCRQTISFTYTIFNTVHAMSDINNIYQFINFKTFEEYLLELKHEQTDRQTEGINAFQLCWKILKSVTFN